MLIENILNFILKFIVGIKMIIDTLLNDKSRALNLVVPIIFGIAWAFVLKIAKRKNGDYDAPPGMLYMQ